MTRLITATLLLILPSMLFAVPLPVNMGVPFELAPGGSAELMDGDLYLVFTGILTDSRCPLGAICSLGSVCSLGSGCSLSPL